MGRRRPERDQAKEVWVASRGKISIRELSEQFGVSEQLLRKWKSQDQWEIKKKRGAPKENQNAKGHGAPKGNRNAQTHGAYGVPDTQNFTAEDWNKVKVAAMLDETLAVLTAKRIDLDKKICALNASAVEKFDTGGVDNVSESGRTEKVVYWESKFQRLEKLEIQWNRVVKNILKVYESVQKSTLEQQRIELERNRIRFAKEKAMGIFETEGDIDTLD